MKSAPRTGLIKLMMAIGILLSGIVVSSAAEHLPISKAASDEVAARAEAILRQMTPDEKLTLIAGGRDPGAEGCISEIPRLKIPRLRMAASACGVRNYGRATSFPATIALAATWNRQQAGRYGAAIAEECLARGIPILLGPGLNIYRLPLCGRNFERLGEDPYLAARMAVAYIKGVQGRGVGATADIFACNNIEWNRRNNNSVVDERALREIYFPAFRAAVEEAGVMAIMGAYNLINGQYNCENPWLLTDVLRGEWGFTGLVMSDWQALSNTQRAATSGLDLEMPHPKFFTKERLQPLLASGAVNEKQIDDMVRHLLRACIAMGFYDNPLQNDSYPRYGAAHKAVALQTEREGIVLLKNERNLLPLDPRKNKEILVVGPNAQNTPTGGGGSSYVPAVNPVSLVEAISSVGAKAGFHVSAFDNGLLVFQTSAGERGLRGEYFRSPNLAGTPALVRMDDSDTRFEWRPRGPTPESYSIRWTGFVSSPSSGVYGLTLESNPSARVFFDDKLIVDDWEVHGLGKNTARLALEAGRKYAVRLEYRKPNNVEKRKAFVGLAIARTTLDPLVPALKKADVVVACVGFNRLTESEGFDRTFTLPPGQGELIETCLQNSPKVVVVLTGGGSIDTARWIARTPAFLHIFYPGQNGAQALAEILTGQVNPSGRLPFTFEKRLEDCPACRTMPPSSQEKKGSDDHTYYDTVYREGIFVGYRYFDNSGIEPLFAFGHGLSYTTFHYADLALTPATIDGKTPVAVSFTLKNTGARFGAEVAEVYVADPVCSQPRPPRELKGFVRVELAPGEERRVSIELGPDAFSFWAPRSKQWTAEPGEFRVLVGASSRDIRLTKSLTLK